MFSAGDHSPHGRTVCRQKAAYAKQTGKARFPGTRSNLKARVYAPVRRNDSVDWKELHAGIARALQYWCSEYKTESMLNIGLIP